MNPFNLYSQYYDLLYKNKNYQMESEHVLKLIQKHLTESCSKIINLGCGTGSHDRYWLEKEIEVIGVDQSSEMLQEAARKNEKYLNQRKARYVQSDLTILNLGETSKVVVSLFDVFSYLTTNESLDLGFSAVSKHLEKGGLFIFDAWYGPCVLTEQPIKKTRTLENEEIHVSRFTEPVLLVNENRVDVHFTIDIQDKKTGKHEIHKELHPVRYLFLPEVKNLARKYGFELLYTEGSMTGKPLGTDTFSALFILVKS